jgi:hypothetical protein
LAGCAGEEHFSEKFFTQKLEYIHQNPVAEEWNLVKDQADFINSSACFYDRGRMPIIEIDDFRELFS